MQEFGKYEVRNAEVCRITLAVHQCNMQREDGGVTIKCQLRFIAWEKVIATLPRIFNKYVGEQKKVKKQITLRISGVRPPVITAENVIYKQNRAMCTNLRHCAEFYCFLLNMFAYV